MFVSTDRILLGSIASLLSSAVASAKCPSITLEDMQGLTPAHPQQFEIDEIQSTADVGLGYCYPRRLLQ